MAVACCPDFTLIPGLKAEEPWMPVGYSLDDELSYLSSSDRAWVVANHPRFTGHCPKCEAAFQESPAVHWDCEVCCWMDDSV